MCFKLKLNFDQIKVTITFPCISLFESFDFLTHLTCCWKMTFTLVLSLFPSKQYYFIGKSSEWNWWFRGSARGCCAYINLISAEIPRAAAPEQFHGSIFITIFSQRQHLIPWPLHLRLLIHLTLLMVSAEIRFLFQRLSEHAMQL